MSVTLADIQAARSVIAGQVLRTPMLPAPRLSALTGASVFVKYENLQVTNSFKERGALNKLASLTLRSCSSNPSVFTTFPGDPKTNDPGGIFVPPVTKVPAPIIDRAPISAPSKIIAPIPTKTSSPIVQACKIALCPPVTHAPTLTP